MNDKIKELKKQCYISVADRVGDTEYDMEKFAELLIRECAKHITDQQDLVETNWQCKDGIHIVYSLKEHFGVTE